MLGSFIWTILTLQAPLAGTAPTTTSEIVREARAMGTEVRITVQADTREHALRLSESLLLEIERRDRLLSTWAPKSPLSQLNRSVPVPEDHAAETAIADRKRFDPLFGRSVVPE